ncbi:hypothetical protein ACE3MZ_16770 [Paenibacillus sp. WLX1005]|uniref:hypothetical protein n=1 Tax=Paenibacillus sp. WLX1005 TaxID=3243766 RepID=UPI003983E8FD
MFNDIDDDSLVSLLKRISTKDDGITVAINILSLLIHGKEKEEISKKIALLGQELIVSVTSSIFFKRDQRLDYEISEILKYCFVDEIDQKNALLVAQNIFSALVNSDLYTRDLDDTLGTLASTYPLIFLDTFFGESKKADDYIALSFTMNNLNSSLHPISLIENSIILQWCNSDPEVRQLTLASAITPYQFIEDEISWTPLAMDLIENSIDPIAILEKLKRKFRPIFWGGSRATEMEQYIPLLLQLQNNVNYIITDWASKEKQKFQSEILAERKFENEYEKNANERFE